MILIALMLASPQAAGVAPLRYDQIVEVDGVRLHVKSKGRNVTIAPRKPLGARTIEAKERARKAVLMVTGCRLTDEFWLNPYYNGLGGALDCSEPPAN